MLTVVNSMSIDKKYDVSQWKHAGVLKGEVGFNCISVFANPIRLNKLAEEWNSILVEEVDMVRMASNSQSTKLCLDEKLKVDMFGFNGRKWT